MRESLAISTYSISIYLERKTLSNVNLLVHINKDSWKFNNFMWILMVTLLFTRGFKVNDKNVVKATEQKI